MATTTKESLQFIVDHVFLPPKLPQAAEDPRITSAAESYLIDVISSQAKIYRLKEGRASENTEAWSIVERMVDRCQALASSPPLSIDVILGIFAGLNERDVFLIQLRAQNAALILRRGQEELTFECFEISPTASSVTTTQGRLVRQFPAHAVSISLSTFDNPEFRRAFAYRLRQLDAEVIDEMFAHSFRANSKACVVRDTPNPGLVTEMLMAILAPFGKAVKVYKIQKHTRDDALWDIESLPWRRSSLWIALRVALHTTLRHLLPEDNAVTQYKNFVLFVMTEIASLAYLRLSDELCDVMKKKIARRGFKLGRNATNFVQDKASKVSQKIETAQVQKWDIVRKEDADRPTTVARRPFDQYTTLSLDASRDYLNKILDQNGTTLHNASSTAPNCKVWLAWSTRGLPSFDKGDRTTAEIIYALTELEIWVADSLPGWKQQRLGTSHSTSSLAQDCMALAELANKYRDEALAVYKVAPEQMSTMILTIAELWQVLDMLAVKILPLLGEFSPGIHLDLFHPLLLPKRGQMERLRVLELHIAARQAQAKPRNPSIFSNPVEKHFTAQYYTTSLSHQTLRKRIEEAASAMRLAKETEWRESTDECLRLRQQAKPMTCAMVANKDRGPIHDSEHCEKCTLNNKADSMRIEVFEWPLPSLESLCASAVVELDCPVEFAAWRNTTWLLVNDLGRSGGIPGASPVAQLLTYPGLREYAQQKASRLTLASTSRAFGKAHSYRLKFPVALDECLAQNSLQYRLYDLTAKVWTEEQLDVPSLHGMCITRLPDGLYENLQYAVDSVNHSQNDVIANQDKCARALSLPEFISFGSLRADGERVQWLNIKRELAASNLSLNAEAVYTLIAQAAWQAGSQAETALRNSHLDAEDPSFCGELLISIEKNLSSIEGNWKSDNAMSILIVLILRILSLAPDSSVTVTTTALNLLQKIRSVIHQWCQTLNNVLCNTTEADHISRIQARLLKVSMLGKMSFDVDAKHLPLAMGTADEIRMWIIFSVHGREHYPARGIILEQDIQRLLLRDLKVSQTLHRYVCRSITADKMVGLDLAISQVWCGFQRGPGSWNMLEAPNDRWLRARTKPAQSLPSQDVLYNVLDGELLIDGKPITRLPTEFTSSEMYLRVFGTLMLRVYLPDMAGMLYMTAEQPAGHRVYFGMRNEDLVIRTRKGSQILELIPHRHFNTDLPAAFVDRFVHWLNISTKEIEFRPLDQRWHSQPGNWRLQYQTQFPSYIHRGDQKLVDMRSNTCADVMTVFGTLDTSEHVHITVSGDLRLEVALPRYDLRFFLNQAGQFECYELCRIVDADQSVGAFIGLKSRLVLCRVERLARKNDRILIVPDGEVSISPNRYHIQARITVSGPSVRLFRYQIDDILGQLRGGNDMEGTIYKAYLHAITAYALPDPLTQRTGTEEAISSLRLHSLNFIEPISTKAIALLTSISALTPRREYCPRNLKVMQRVQWHTVLSMLAQHDEFLPLAERIIRSGDRYAIFYPESKGAPSLYRARDTDLLTRASLRNACYRSYDFGGNDLVYRKDSEYEARDREYGTERGNKSFEISLLVRDWPNKLEVSTNLSKDLKQYSLVSGFGTKFDASSSLSELLKASFDTSWGPLQSLCLESSKEHDTYTLLFLFPVIAYSSGVISLTVLRTLLAYAFVPELQAVPVPPGFSFFAPAKSKSCNDNSLRAIIMRNMYPYSGPGRRRHQAQWHVNSEEHDKRSAEQASIVLRAYKRQWPCKEPSTPSKSLASQLDWRRASQEVSDLFLMWFANRAFSQYLQQIQPILESAHKISPRSEYMPSDRSTLDDLPALRDACVLPSLSSILSAIAPRTCSKPMVLKIARTLKTPEINGKLRALIAALRCKIENSSDNTIRVRYCDDLSTSLDTFAKHKERITPKNLPCSLEEALLHHINCVEYVENALKDIRDALGARNSSSKFLEVGGLWPRITVRSLLPYLSSKSPLSLGPAWKACLLSLGEAITSLQRGRRLVLAVARGDVSTFCMEVEHEGHQGWQSERYPDWLLIELEGDFLIRPTQAQVALEMIEPSSCANSLVQLNMGEGKSSVIVPLVAVAIADSSRLSRIVVLKSLARQMSDTMIQRLGGLVDRQVYFMPFSRKVQVNEAVISRIQSLQASCLEDRGILLAQPEHILSFSLMGIERLTTGEFEVAAQLMKSQRWLRSNVRDVLDESDEILDVNFQLIYTMGTQRMMDGQPDRWLITQGLFELVATNASIIETNDPRHIELERRTSSSFPTIRLLTTDVGRRLSSMVAHDIVESHLPGLSFEHHSEKVRFAALHFIQELQVSDEDCMILKSTFSDQGSLIQKLLLVRGLIAYKILLFVLSKRWSVNYGLHPFRCLSAVPYRAKGVPAPSAEFGHPDVAVALTCLSYYYTGLSDSQIRDALENLQKSDDPSREYTSWVRQCDSIPESLRSWTAVNLDDDHQCYEELFPALRYGKRVADFYLAAVVFPKEGKEFDEKLSTSGWDLVAKNKQHLTTGFSGTNDNRFVLPLSISQRDLPELQHTSGKVLNYVLREDNIAYHCARDNVGRHLSAEGLIRFISQIDSSIRVLIDVGAQVLDVHNRGVVEAWMDVAPHVDAGVFFDEGDNVMVVTRDAKLEKLAVSSFQNRMDRCVVYLDEVHTRGTDLKLPTTARAAVTLGPRLTKDRLVQACMRLRKLAQGQTLMFLAPPEVHQNIMEFTGKEENDVDGYDVIAWSLEQSCLSIEQSQALRIIQGFNYSKRQTVMDNFSTAYVDLEDPAREIDLSSDLIKAFREKEEQMLNDLYAPLALKTKIVPSVIESCRESMDPTVQELLEMWGRLNTSTSEGLPIHEEHEREIAHEVEQETQVERPPPVQAVPRKIDPHLRDFVLTGDLDSFVNFALAHISVIKLTSAEDPNGGNHWVHLRVTEDFANVVERPQSGYYDNYLRPVNWVLTSKTEVKANTLLLLSQYEVNEVLRDIQRPTSGVNLHMYEPRVTKTMTPVDYGVEPMPPSMYAWKGLGSGLRRELHLFAGQLYLNTYKDYEKLCKDLNRRKDQSLEQTLSFMKAFTAIRRRGQPFSKTHVGQIVDGRTIKKDAFEWE